MANLKVPTLPDGVPVKLYFAVVDMAGEPGMAEVERPEDCRDEDAYVRISDFERQAAHIAELEADSEGEKAAYDLMLRSAIDQRDDAERKLSKAEARCEATEWLAEVVDFRENGPGFGGITADAAAEEFDAIFAAALRAVEG